MVDGALQGYDALRRRIAAIRGPVLGKDIMRTLALATKKEAANVLTANGSVKTGNLRRSLDVGAVTDNSARVVARARYGMFVELGTKAHEITPRAASALRWAASSSSGFRLTGRPSSAKGNSIGWAFAKRVHHPGTRAKPFLKPGAEAAIQGAGLAERIVSAWDKAA
jgi:hypothetical protein